MHSETVGPWFVSSTKERDQASALALRTRREGRGRTSSNLDRCWLLPPPHCAQMATKRAASSSPGPSGSSTQRLYPSAGPASANKRPRIQKGQAGCEEQQAQPPPEKRLKLFKKGALSTLLSSSAAALTRAPPHHPTASPTSTRLTRHSLPKSDSRARGPRLQPAIFLRRTQTHGRNERRVQGPRLDWQPLHRPRACLRPRKFEACSTPADPGRCTLPRLTRSRRATAPTA